MVNGWSLKRILALSECLLGSILGCGSLFAFSNTYAVLEHSATLISEEEVHIRDAFVGCIPARRGGVEEFVLYSLNDKMTNVFQPLADILTPL